ncbi:MAG: hypothetical protein HC768_21180 [Acaryochloris sp. CRU_2_0]|nr:hypothetical protein [Acaryochloris sp. CRU_2_0]
MSAFKDLYNTAKATEDTVFAISPIPLSFVKSGIQNVGVPLAVGAVATHAPFVAPIASAAINWGSDAFQSGMHSLASQAMNSFGESVASGLPSALGIQSSFNWMSSQMSQVILAGQDMATHAVGAVGTTVMLGRTIANSTTLAFQKIRGMTVGEMIAGGQRAIQRSVEFAVSAAKQVRHLGHKAEQFVHKEVAKLTQNNNEKETLKEAPQTVLASESTQVETPKTVVASESTRVEASKTTMTSDATPVEGSNGKPPGVKYQEPEQQGSEHKAPVFEPKNSQNNTAPQTPTPTTPKSSIEAEDFVLRLVDSLTKANLNTDRLYIKMDGVDIFKMNKGAPDPLKTSITTAQKDALEQALQDPAAFGGNLVIKQGNKVLLNIQQGRILHNPLGLAQQSTSVELETKPQAQQVVPNNAAEGLWSKYGATVSNDMKGIKLATENALKDGIAPKEVRAMLGQSEHFKGIQDQKGETAAEKAIARTVSVAQTRILQEQRPKQQEQQSQRQAEVMAPGL